MTRSGFHSHQQLFLGSLVILTTLNQLEYSLVDVNNHHILSVVLWIHPPNWHNHYPTSVQPSWSSPKVAALFLLQESITWNESIHDKISNHTSYNDAWIRPYQNLFYILCSMLCSHPRPRSPSASLRAASSSITQITTNSLFFLPNFSSEILRVYHLSLFTGTVDDFWWLSFHWLRSIEWLRRCRLDANPRRFPGLHVSTYIKYWCTQGIIYIMIQSKGEWARIEKQSSSNDSIRDEVIRYNNISFKQNYNFYILLPMLPVVRPWLAWFAYNLWNLLIKGINT